MERVTEFALIAGNTYSVSAAVNAQQNAVPLPQRWVPFQLAAGGMSIRDDTTGLLASAYTNGSEIVVSYGGTTSEVGTRAADWINGNIPAAIGVTLAPQILQAAQFYLNVQRLNFGNVPVRFTGHSLGGGLASLMSVYFDRQSIVFDPAMFERSADSPLVIDALRSELIARGYSTTELGALASYVAGSSVAVNDDSPSRLERQHNVTSVIVRGELLSSIPDPIYPAIGPFSVGAIVPIGTGIHRFFGHEDVLDPLAVLGHGWSAASAPSVDLHSIRLLSMLSISPELLAIARATPEFLQGLFTSALSDIALVRTDPNLLNLLLDREVANQGAISRLVDDLSRTNGGWADDTDLRFRMIRLDLASLYDQSIANLPDQGRAPILGATTLVTGGLQYQRPSQFSAVSAWTDEFVALRRELAGKLSSATDANVLTLSLLRDGDREFDDLVIARGLGLNAASRADHSTLAVGFSQADTIGGSDRSDVLIGLAGSDTLNGGAGNDVLDGGADDDVLSGGTGDDLLFGGTGNEIYSFDGNFGTDVVTDADGLGRLMLNGVQLVGGRSAGAPNTWVQRLGENDYVGYVVIDDASSSTGKKLVIARPGSDGRIVVNNFDLAAALRPGGSMGIALDNTPRITVREGTGTNPYFDGADATGQVASATAISFGERGDRKLPRQVDSSKVDESRAISRSRYNAGGRLPSASWGRISL